MGRSSLTHESNAKNTLRMINNCQRCFALSQTCLSELPFKSKSNIKFTSLSNEKRINASEKAMKINEIGECSQFVTCAQPGLKPINTFENALNNREYDKCS